MIANKMFKNLGYSVYLKEDLLVYTLKYELRTIKKIVFFLSKQEINVGGGEKNKVETFNGRRNKSYLSANERIRVVRR